MHDCVQKKKQIPNICFMRTCTHTCKQTCKRRHISYTIWGSVVYYMISHIGSWMYYMIYYMGAELLYMIYCMEAWKYSMIFPLWSRMYYIQY